LHVLKSVIPVLLCLLVVDGAGVSLAATKKPATRHPAAKRAVKTAAKSRSKAAPPHRTASASTRAKAGARTSTRTSTRGSTRTSPRAAKRKTQPVVHRSVQQVPTPERYREIQQALSDKGYFQGEVNGTWGPGSVDALKRFQKDQNLTDSGKLDSLSIIALGLGPKRNLSARSTTESRPKDDNRRPEGSERP
jgi:hypothetical protein